MIKKIDKKINGGYSLIEMIIYVCLLSIVSIAVISVIFSFMRSYKSVQTNYVLDNSAINAMEKITRNIRMAKSVNAGASDFISNPGILTIDTASTTSQSIKFYTQNGVLKMDIDGSYFGPLTGDKITVSGLKFWLLDNGVSKAIRLDLNLQTSSQGIIYSKNFHSTIILKGK